jgi:extracellular solute-binding protein family 5
MKNKVFRILGICASFALLLSACSNSSTTSSSAVSQADSAASVSEETTASDSDLARLENKEELRIAVKAFTTLDPCMGWGQYGPSLIQSKLMQINSTSIEKDLATEYSVSDDGLVWTFKIRDDVKFHDGSKLTAADVAFTFNNTKAIAGKVDLANMDEAVAIDDTTVEFRMNKPFSSFLYNTAALAIVPEKSYVDSATYSKNPIGSGPYKFVQYDEGQQLIMERNDDYYADKSNFKKLVLIMMDTSSAFAAVQAGTVDMAKVDEQSAQTQVGGYYLKEFTTYDYRSISMPYNTPGTTTEEGDPIGNAVTSDVAVRKALSLGISREGMVQNALAGYGEATFDVFSKFDWGLGDLVKDVKDGDVEAAKKILDEAGWVEGSDGIREKDGVKAEFELLYGANAVDRQAIAMSFAEEAKKLGISVKPVGKDYDEIKKLAKSTPMVLGGGHCNPMNVDMIYDGRFAKITGWSNVIGYSNEKTDKYIEQAFSAKTDEEANEFWQKVSWDGTEGPSVLGETCYIPICYIRHLYFVRDGIDLGKDVILAHDHGAASLQDVIHWDYKAAK